jgi:CDP-diacylglycerol--serine O-phosphatidyltransferase
MAPKRKSRAKTRRTIYVVPNLITALSLFAGFYGLIAAINDRYLAAAAAILVAAILDSLDGAVARATNTTSLFGREYDSLCDLVAFGAAPAVLMYQWALKPGKLMELSAMSGETKTLSLGLIAAFIYVACGSLRLARFNTSASQLDPGFFQGIPITGGAVILSSAVLWSHRGGRAAPPESMLMLALVLATAFLMVSTFDYISLKHRAFSKNQHPFETLVLFLLVFGILIIKARTFLLPLCVAYMALGPAVTLFRRRARAAGPQAGGQGRDGDPPPAGPDPGGEAPSP